MSADSRDEILQKYVGDMHAVIKHTLEVCRRQSESAAMKASREGGEVVNRIVEVLTRHHDALHLRAKEVGADGNAAVMDTLTAVTGAMTGLYDKIRSETASKMLRDDYVALTMSAMAYEMLHTTALALKDEGTATLSLTLMRDLPPLIWQIGDLVPTVVVRELAEKGVVVDQTVADRAAQNSVSAWRRHSDPQAA